MPVQRPKKSEQSIQQSYYNAPASHRCFGKSDCPESSPSNTEAHIKTLHVGRVQRP